MNLPIGSYCVERRAQGEAPNSECKRKFVIEGDSRKLHEQTCVSSFTVRRYAEDFVEDTNAYTHGWGLLGNRESSF